ncbi:hypothetical protein ONZ45_g12704 [Pleurotus djamor]|nr:hypothetical protein ONZ45_g12704 [Pleurotus djamor]
MASASTSKRKSLDTPPSPPKKARKAPRLSKIDVFGDDAPSHGSQHRPLPNRRTTMNIDTRDLPSTSLLAKTVKTEGKRNAKGKGKDDDPIIISDDSESEDPAVISLSDGSGNDQPSVSAPPRFFSSKTYQTARKHSSKLKPQLLIKPESRTFVSPVKPKPLPKPKSKHKRASEPVRIRERNGIIEIDPSDDEEEESSAVPIPLPRLAVIRQSQLMQDKGKEREKPPSTPSSPLRDIATPPSSSNSPKPGPPHSSSPPLPCDLDDDVDNGVAAGPPLTPSSLFSVDEMQMDAPAEAEDRGGEPGMDDDTFVHQPEQDEEVDNDEADQLIDEDEDDVTHTLLKERASIAKSMSDSPMGAQVEVFTASPVSTSEPLAHPIRPLSLSLPPSPPSSSPPQQHGQSLQKQLMSNEEDEITDESEGRGAEESLDAHSRAQSFLPGPGVVSTLIPPLSLSLSPSPPPSQPSQQQFSSDTPSAEVNTLRASLSNTHISAEASVLTPIPPLHLPSLSPPSSSSLSPPQLPRLSTILQDNQRVNDGKDDASSAVQVEEDVNILQDSLSNAHIDTPAPLQVAEPVGASKQALPSPPISMMTETAPIPPPLQQRSQSSDESDFELEYWDPPEEVDLPTSKPVSAGDSVPVPVEVPIITSPPAPTPTPTPTSTQTSAPEAESDHTLEGLSAIASPSLGTEIEVEIETTIPSTVQLDIEASMAVESVAEEVEVEPRAQHTSRPQRWTMTSPTPVPIPSRVQSEPVSCTLYQDDETHPMSAFLSTLATFTAEYEGLTMPPAPVDFKAYWTCVEARKRYQQLGEDVESQLSWMGIHTRTNPQNPYLADVGRVVRSLTDVSDKIKANIRKIDEYVSAWSEPALDASCLTICLLGRLTRFFSQTKPQPPTSNDVPMLTHSPSPSSSRSTTPCHTPSDRGLALTSSKSYGGVPAYTWSSLLSHPTNFLLPYKKSIDLPRSLPDHVNRMDPWARSLPGMRTIFQAAIQHNTSLDEPEAPLIRVWNKVDDEPCPLFEFYYSNEMWLGEGVPPPDMGTLRGCGCYPVCDPKNKGCECLERQKAWTAAYTPDYAYDARGRLKQQNIPIFECNELCGCDSDCRNRVVQRGRKVEVGIAKTKNKGWGVFSGSSRIPSGTFIGIYAGELLTDAVAEVRGKKYNKWGRTYLFDVDFWFLRKDEAESGVGMNGSQGMIEDWDTKYVVDAYHAGNFTRFLNHSCSPNARLNATYINDSNIQKPLLTIFACKDIEPHTEICFSYNGNYDDDDDDDAPVDRKDDAVYERCACGAKNCKGTVFS